MTTTGAVDNTTHITVTWTDAAKPADWRSWRVYGRRTIDSGWTILHETFVDSASYSYDVYQFFVGVPGEYVVAYTTQASASPVLVESNFTGDAVAITPSGDGHFWLIDPLDPALNIRLEHVTDFPLSDEWEQESYHIVGRGRKQDIGDRLGWTGSMTGRLYDMPALGLTAVDQRLQLENLRRASVTYFLRSPFGRTFQVGLTSLSFTPIAGVGPVEQATSFSAGFEELGGAPYGQRV